MTTRWPLCLFLQATAPGREVADGTLGVPAEEFEAEAVDAHVSCVVETEVDLESCWMDEGV